MTRRDACGFYKVGGYGKEKAAFVRWRCLLPGVKVALIQHPGCVCVGGVLGGLVWDDTMSGNCHKTLQKKLRSRLITIITEAGDGRLSGLLYHSLYFCICLEIFRIKSSRRIRKKEPGD